MSIEETLEELRVWYNGYKFEEDASSVYNPVSLMKCFMNEKFKNYWFETGTPTFLLDLLKHKPIDLGNLRPRRRIRSRCTKPSACMRCHCCSRPVT